MIEAREAVRIARSLIGTPYAQMDCIALIRAVIRSAEGGDSAYRCEGTNWLWRSYEAVGKYRHLIWRGEGVSGARAGMLAFKRREEDVHHVGVVTGEGTVVHASSEAGAVVETALDGGWHLLAWHKHISEEAESYGRGEGVVRTQGGKLNVRESPDGRVIAQMENGAPVDILGEAGDWLRVAMGEGREGYVSGAYVERTAFTGRRIRIIDAAGKMFFPEGKFTVEPESATDCV